MLRSLLSSPMWTSCSIAALAVGRATSNFCATDSSDQRGSRAIEPFSILTLNLVTQRVDDRPQLQYHPLLLHVRTPQWYAYWSPVRQRPNDALVRVRNAPQPARTRQPMQAGAAAWRWRSGAGPDAAPRSRLQTSIHVFHFCAGPPSCQSGGVCRRYGCLSQRAIGAEHAPSKQEELIMLDPRKQTRARHCAVLASLAMTTLVVGHAALAAGRHDWRARQYAIARPGHVGTRAALQRARRPPDLESGQGQDDQRRRTIGGTVSSFSLTNYCTVASQDGRRRQRFHVDRDAALQLSTGRRHGRCGRSLARLHRGPTVPGDADRIHPQARDPEGPRRRRDGAGGSDGGQRREAKDIIQMATTRQSASASTVRARPDHLRERARRLSPDIQRQPRASSS